MANDDQNNRDYSVGRGKPPIESRFRKGRSGNPKGRPPGSRNTCNVVGDELDTTAKITENGRRRIVTKRPSDGEAGRQQSNGRRSSSFARW